MAEVAGAFEVHPNVARYHLDHLVDAGYLQVKRAPTGSGAGRPAHLYEITERQIHIDLPAQSFEFLALMLTQVLHRVAGVDTAELAYQVGLAHGERLATSLELAPDADLAAAVEAAADTMEGLGFRTSTRLEGNECGYETTHCPFGKVALENPRIVCALDRGVVTGLVSALRGSVEVTVVPHVRIAEPCMTLIVRRP